MATQKAAAPALVSSERIFPQTYRRSTTGKIVNLSLVDASAANFSDSAVVWYIDGAVHENQRRLSAEHLKSTLELALRGYDHFCGRLHIAPYIEPHGSYGRIQVTVNQDDKDPGVEFRVCSDEKNLDQIVPDGRHAVPLALWIRDHAQTMFLLSPTKLAEPLKADPPIPNPSMAVQITNFACGGLAISLKISHVLADAQTVMVFMKDWSAISRTVLSEASIPAGPPAPIEPASLDGVISGDISKPSPSPEILHHAHSLPVHRYDWWASAVDCPFPGGATQIPEALHDNPAATTQSGTRIPWAEWDMAAKCTQCTIHISGPQIHALWREASSNGAVSRQDAVLAHIWSCVNRARGLQNDDGPVHCDVTLGLRTRLALPPSPSPASSSGSFTMLADVRATGREAASPAALGPLAARIRSTLGAFDKPAVAALLHALHYEASPQRIWQGFLGRRHLLVTSWVRAGLYEVDFDGTKAAAAAGGGGRASLRYADPVMQNLDGLVCMAEGPPLADGLGHKGGVREEGGGPRTAHWADDGIDVHVYLEAGAMDALLKDPLLLPAA